MVLQDFYRKKTKQKQTNNKPKNPNQQVFIYPVSQHQPKKNRVNLKISRDLIFMRHHGDEQWVDQ